MNVLWIVVVVYFCVFSISSAETCRKKLASTDTEQKHFKKLDFEQPKNTGSV